MVPTDPLGNFETRLLAELLETTASSDAMAAPRRRRRWAAIASVAAAVVVAASVTGFVVGHARPAAAFTVEPKPGGGVEVRIQRPLTSLEVDALEQELVRAGASASLVKCSRDQLPKVVVTDVGGGEAALIDPTHPGRSEINIGPMKQEAVTAARAALAGCGVTPTAEPTDAAPDLKPRPGQGESAAQSKP